MKDLTQGNIFKNFTLFAIPLILSNVLSVAYNTVDLIIVSRCLGENGLAAVGSTATFMEILNSVLWGLGTGSSIYLATLFGAKKYRDFTNAIKLNLIAMGALSLLLALLVFALKKPIFAFLNIGEDIAADAWLYLAIYLTGLVFLGINWHCGYIFNAMGNPSFPLKLSLFSFVGNIVGDLVLIQGLGMGVAGAALATVLFAFLTALLYLAKFRREFAKMGCAGQKLYFEAKSLTRAGRLGLPNMVQQFIMYLASTMVQPLINGIGPAAIAGYAASMKLYSLNSLIFQSSSKALMNYSAQCMGAGKFSQISRGLKTSLAQVFLFTLPMMAVCLIAPRFFAGLFFTDPYCEGAGYTVQYLLFCIPFLPLQVLDNLFHNFYRGVLKIPVIVVSTAINTVVRIGLAYLLAPKLGMNGIYTALVISWGAEALYLAGLYLSGRWKTEEFRRAEQA